MNNLSLARSYLVKAEKRLKILDVLLADEAFSDVIREAQEIVELALKGMLRQVGVSSRRNGMTWAGLSWTTRTVFLLT